MGHGVCLKRGDEIPILIRSDIWFGLRRDTVLAKQFDLASMFRDYTNDLAASNHLPSVVLENRRQRAQKRIQDALASRGSDRVSPALAREIRQLVSRWARQSFADGFKEMEEFEIRCAREHDLVIAQSSGNTEEILKALAADYRQRVIDQYSRIELRGVQTSERVYFELDKVFVPLYLAESTSPLYHIPQMTQELDAILRHIARLPVLNVLRSHRHLLIVGAPGSGKTTLVAYLATSIAEGRLFEGDHERQELLPFILTVRTFTTGKITSKSIARLTDCDERLVQYALETDRAILFVDGLDEVPRHMVPQILQSLGQLCTAYPKTSVVVTSRPSGAAHDLDQVLPGYISAELLAMTRDEVESFIDKWCLAAEVSVSSDIQVAERKAREAANNLKQRLEHSRSIQRLVETPLLATILCVVHRFLGHRIPEHRVTLYEKCTDALLYEWDRSKFGHGALVGELDALAKRMLLSGLARQMHEHRQAEIPEAEVLAHFDQALPDLGHKAGDAKQIVGEIRDRSGVLIERRSGFFAFSHLVFQEYLTALAFTPQSYNELVNHFEDSWWHEVIILAAGIQGADAGRLANALLEKKGPIATFLTAQCLETAVQIPIEIREKIELQLRKFVPPQTGSDINKLAQLGIIVAPALTKALGEQLSDNEAINTLVALISIDYEPAIGAIARFATGGNRSDALWEEIQLIAFYVLARKALSSKLAKATFLASIPKIQSQGTLEALPIWLKPLIEASGAESQERKILQELLDALPPEAKKD